MKNFFSLSILVPSVLALVSCADIHPVKTVGPDTYQITHTVAKNAPTTGISNGLTEIAQQKCAEQDNAPFHKVSEEVKTERYQTVILTFQCKPVLGNTQYTGSYASGINTPPLIMSPTTLASFTTPSSAALKGQ